MVQRKVKIAPSKSRTKLTQPPHGREPAESEVDMTTPARKLLPGSERYMLSTSHVVDDADQSTTIKVTVYARQNPAGLNLPPADDISALTTPAFQRLSPSDKEAAFGADPADLKKIEAFAAANDLSVLESSPAKRSVLLSGTVAAFSAAFGVHLKIYDSPFGRYRGRVGPVTIPTELDGVIDSVFGLDNRRMGRPYLKKGGSPIPSRSVSHSNVYVPPQVAQLYNFPPGFDGTGQCIGVLAFNGELASTGITATGGYNIDAVRKYFTEVLHLQVPQIVDVVVHGPGNVPGDESSDEDISGEVMLDIQVAGSCAPGARLAIYFTEFTEQGWVDAVVSAVTDQVNKLSVLSISYGNPEDGGSQTLWTKAAIRMVNSTFKRAALDGITICCAAGDDGSPDAIRDGFSHVDFPASSPFVLGCGGTRLESTNGVITKETAWNDGPGSASGGGISTLFALPAFQRGAQVPSSANPGHRIGRGVPDVSGLADPDTGLVIMSNNGELEPSPVGGTSATAPLWAALVACINQALGTKVGFLNPFLYHIAGSNVLRDIIAGDNGAYPAAAGWDACTGLGSPNGARLLSALQRVPPVSNRVSASPASDPIAAALAAIQCQLAADTSQRGQLQIQIARLEAMLVQLAPALIGRLR
jgi:kumamolisin